MTLIYSPLIRMSLENDFKVPTPEKAPKGEPKKLEDLSPEERAQMQKEAQKVAGKIVDELEKAKTTFQKGPDKKMAA